MGGDERKRDDLAKHRTPLYSYGLGAYEPHVRLAALNKEYKT